METTNEETVINYVNNFKTFTNNNFDFSEFQNKACNSIINKEHVLITAHTGSGKTLPAEFAIYYFIKVLNKKVIYTSPIKALSNQKYKEFTTKFNDIEVGILTGDIKHNPNADLLIMTTEILQNNCFKKQNRGLYMDFNIDIENELGCVIFDEVHYIDDYDRGTVWEQTMIMLPDNVIFVMLSATIGHKEQFAQWIENIKNRKVTICSNETRVVPLNFYEFFSIPKKYIDNIKNKDKKVMFENKLNKKLNLIKNNKVYCYEHLKNSSKCLKETSKDNYRIYNKYVINECLDHLRDNDMFPSIFFVFSRKNVEKIASQITTNLFLKDEKDYQIEPVYRNMIVKKLNNWKEYMEIPEYKIYLDLLEKGIGIHHAGMLPVFREVIEQLYEQKYIKALIATETFAIGLNMPTRTVVFSSLYKHDGNKSRLLKSHEFTQMAGRAGRRNIDTVGHVILLSNCYNPPTETEYYNLFHTKPKVLVSKFKLTYNIILNYLNDYSKDDFVNMVGKSLMNNDIISQKTYSKKQLEIYSEEKKRNDELINTLDFDVIEYFKEKGELVERMKYSNNKTKKQLKKKIDEMSDKKKDIHIDVYNKFNEINKNIQNENENYEYANNFVYNQVEAVFNILKQNMFIDDNETKDKDKPSQYGLNASYIHEIPPLVFIDFYNHFDKFETYSEEDILSILCCFYELKLPDDKKMNVPKTHKKELTFIQDRMNYYEDIESQHNIYLTCKYNLQYDLMEDINEWYSNVNNVDECKIFYHNLKTEKDIFIGDFIKCCLKIVNICNELKLLCENDTNYSFLQKIINIQEKLQKNIVTSKSIYV